MKTKLLYLVIIIPLFISGFISFFIINNRTKNRSNQPAALQAPDVQRPAPTAPFGMPGKNADASTKELYLRNILTNAVKATTLDVADCKPNPKIIQVTTNTQFTLTNSGNEPREIAITDSNIYTIPAKGKVLLVAEFGKGTGAYDYRCDGSSVPVGVIVVMNP